MNNKTEIHFEDDSSFHAGRFLSEALQEEGCDVLWLSVQMGMDEEALKALLNQPNMDARFFVEVGEKIDPLFMRRVHEMIFGKQSYGIKIE